ncbi:Transcriptional regulator [Leptospira biflexa serovar Patoc strain 'Patoc 1 (Ames)']|uniref:Putative transcriptional regulator, AraC family putative membrane protein n=2 Tax=Leptospira biflexa TaxID=172 RepID=B0SL80_LEPBP|nr:Transcriptional regulator [Leptospira biflexa serovar Patoc strain 'Patoc 1 (Ames)']ABZ96887.1 Putative transcriptional regulator, AraC family; putative membrane protein [Leptospira biflexa serovar Patoc strain 'Patoc 1 (Paris)']
MDAFFRTFYFMGNVMIHLIAFSAGLAFLFAIGEFLRTNSSRQTKVQGLLFLFAAFFQTHTYLTATELYQVYPHFYLVHLPFTACIGSLLKQYFSELWNDSPNKNEFSYLELAPAFLVTFLMTPFYLSSAEEKIMIHQSYLKIGVPLPFQIIILIAVLPIFYSAYYVFSQMVRYIRWDRFKKSAHLRLVGLVVGFGAFASAIGVYTLFFHARHGLQIVSTFIGFLIIGIYLLRQKSPELWGEVQRIVIEEKKYQTSQLGSFDLEDLHERLKLLMETKKVYLDETINLEKLAKQMNLSEHQLSEFLNSHLKKSFFHLVNHYRIKEAKDFFIQHPEKNILTVAYEVGFPSKSTFYDAFKREVGQSPSEYRKNLKK